LNYEGSHGSDIKSTIFWDETPSGLLEVTNVLEHCTASIFTLKEQTNQAINNMLAVLA
jgi:hypothetical protein